jgi:hypothetical protein
VLRVFATQSRQLPPPGAALHELDRHFVDGNMNQPASWWNCHIDAPIAVRQHLQVGMAHELAIRRDAQLMVGLLHLGASRCRGSDLRHGGGSGRDDLKQLVSGR